MVFIDLPLRLCDTFYPKSMQSLPWNLLILHWFAYSKDLQYVLQLSLRVLPECFRSSRVIQGQGQPGSCQTFSNLLAHLVFSSSDRRRFERSIYPFSSSTLTTTAHSSRPTRTNLLIERIRRRDSSDNRIIPKWNRQMPSRNVHSSNMDKGVGCRFCVCKSITS